MGKWIVGMVVFVLIVGALFGSSGSDDDDAPDKKGDPGKRGPSSAERFGDEIGAQVVCQDFVERRLKSPSTADFSDETVTQVRGPVWLVVGSVDSENSFGAMIRNQYRCKVKFTGDDNWRLQDLSGLSN